jgi:hypothetical protein
MNDSQFSLQGLVGSVIQAVIPIWSHDSVVREFKLHGVEAGGLWLESQELTDNILKALGIATAPKTVALFVPYHHVQFVVGLVDQSSLSEKALGL